MKLALFAAVALATVATTYGDVYPFSSITANDNSGSSQNVGEEQLYLEVTESGTGQATLLFTNAGPIASFISSIYFDFTSALDVEILAINNTASVYFNEGKGNLPAGKSIDDRFISELSLHATSPAAKNGINAHESLSLIVGYDDTYDLFDSIENQTLRMGLHVQGFQGGFSESFINGNEIVDPIPEPGVLSMLLLGSFVIRRLRFLITS